MLPTESVLWVDRIICQLKKIKKWFIAGSFCWVFLVSARHWCWWCMWRSQYGSCRQIRLTPEEPTHLRTQTHVQNDELHMSRKICSAWRDWDTDGKSRNFGFASWNKVLWELKRDLQMIEKVTKEYNALRFFFRTQYPVNHAVLRGSKCLIDVIFHCPQVERRMSPNRRSSIPLQM